MSSRGRAASRSRAAESRRSEVVTPEAAGARGVEIVPGAGDQPHVDAPPCNRRPSALPALPVSSNAPSCGSPQPAALGGLRTRRRSPPRTACPGGRAPARRPPRGHRRTTRARTRRVRCARGRWRRTAPRGAGPCAWMARACTLPVPASPSIRTAARVSTATWWICSAPVRSHAIRPAADCSPRLVRQRRRGARCGDVARADAARRANRRYGRDRDGDRDIGAHGRRRPGNGRRTARAGATPAPRGRESAPRSGTWQHRGDVLLTIRPRDRPRVGPARSAGPIRSGGRRRCSPRASRQRERSRAARQRLFASGCPRYTQHHGAGGGEASRSFWIAGSWCEHTGGNASG